MIEKMTVISEKDLEACDNDRKAYLALSVLLFNKLLWDDPEFKNSYEYDKALEVLNINAKTM